MRTHKEPTHTGHLRTNFPLKPALLQVPEPRGVNVAAKAFRDFKINETRTKQRTHKQHVHSALESGALSAEGGDK
ncbi:Hypothetical predicted protein [Podarcis lilfordi]|uniref:Uncharacterized protein n=1 Tax=Podarcis lilfordi TaxID=74358 RepID=A0AA35PB89_9SAUR|nr:Hypothetical predicted protein [Podarcis lilfordi]